MRMLSIGLVIAIACALTGCASHRHVSGIPPCLHGIGPACSAPGLQVCPAIAAGYSSCTPTLGPAAQNGEDANLGYDINAATGNLFLAQPDIHGHPAIGPDLDFVRYYNSQSGGKDVGLGPNWTHSFSWFLSFQNAPTPQAEVVADTGKVITFTPNPSGGAWVAPPGEFGSLVALNGSLCAQGSACTYITKYGVKYLFDGSGKLTSIQDAAGLALTILYLSGKITSVTSAGPSPLQLAFSYSTDGHIANVTDSTGATWFYGFSPVILPTAGNQVTLTQSGTGLLQSVTRPSTSPSSAFQPMTLYSYSPQSIGSKTFSPGKALAALTGYAALISATQQGSSGIEWTVDEAILGLFNYSNPVSGPQAVTEAVGGVIKAGVPYSQPSYSFLRDVQLSYAVNSNGTQIVTTAALNGASRIITSDFPAGPGFPRITSVIFSPGAGPTGGASSSGSWIWNGNLTLAQATDGNGNVTVFGPYDALGNPKQIQEGYKVSYTCTSQGCGPQASAARTTTIVYHPVLSLPLSVSRPSVDGIPGHERTIVWNYDQNPVSISPNQNPTNLLYQVIDHGYTDITLSGKVSSEVAYVVTMKRDSMGRISSIAGPLPGSSTTLDYLPAGYLWHRRDIASANSTHTTTFWGYDNDGRLTAFTDPNGNNVQLQYDPQGSVISKSISSADWTMSTSVAYQRDFAENVTQRVTPDGIVMVDRDAALRPWRVTGVPQSGVAAWSRVTDFDSFGQPVTVRMFAGSGHDEGPGCVQNPQEQRCVEYVYDVYERLLAIHTLDWTNKLCPLPACANYYLYDGNGNVTQGQGDLTHYDTYTYDALNRITLVTDRNGGKYTAAYDINGNAIDRDDARDSKNGGGGGEARDTLFVYDDFGRQISVTNQDINTWISNYDEAGDLVASMDANGAVLNYSYDGLGRRTSVTSPNMPTDNVNFMYDTASSGLSVAKNTQGRLAGMSSTDINGNNMSTYLSYDYRGRVIVQWDQRQIGGAALSTYTTSYSWNPNDDHLDAITYPDGLVVTRKYSSAYGPKPKVSEIDIPFDGASSIPVVSNVQYSAAGQPVSFVSGSGSSTSNTYNARGELTYLNISNPSYDYPYSPIWRENLTYGADPSVLGEISEVDFFKSLPNAWAWTMKYDFNQQLLSWANTSQIWLSFTTVPPSWVSVPATLNWTYDEVGNRTSESSNKPSAGAPTNYVYDSSGNFNQLLGAPGSSQSYDQTAIGFWQLDPPGAASVVTGTNLSYDKNGDVVNDNFLTISGLGTVSWSPDPPRVSNQLYVAQLVDQFSRSFLYNARHHLKEVDLSVGGSLLCAGADPANQPLCSVWCPQPTTGCLAPLTSPLQQYSYDALDHVTEVNCKVDVALTSLIGSQSGYGVCQTNPLHDVQYFYDVRGRLIEELDLTASWPTNQCPTYDIIDHIYMGNREIARVLRKGNPSAVCHIQTMDSDIQYLHHDDRGATIAVESQSSQSVVWEAATSPQGQTIKVGLPGPSGQIGANDSLPAAIKLDPGVGGALPDGQLGTWSITKGELTPDVGRSMTPTGAVLKGLPAYNSGDPGPGGGPLPDAGSPAYGPASQVNWDNPYAVTAGAVAGVKAVGNLAKSSASRAIFGEGVAAAGGVVSGVGDAATVVFLLMAVTDHFFPPTNGMSFEQTLSNAYRMTYFLQTLGQPVGYGQPVRNYSGKTTVGTYPDSGAIQGKPPIGGTGPTPWNSNFGSPSGDIPGNPSPTAPPPVASPPLQSINLAPPTWDPQGPQSQMLIPGQPTATQDPTPSGATPDPGGGGYIDPAGSDGDDGGDG